MEKAMEAENLKLGFRRFLEGVNFLLWPAVCMNCGEVIAEADKHLCHTCWDELLACTAGDYCPRCGNDAGRYALIDGACPACQGTDLYFDGIARAGVYDGSLKKMIRDFKFSSKTELNFLLAHLLKSALEGSSFKNDIDYFAAVPMHWIRRLFRGYNHSLILTKKTRPADSRINTDLVRIKRTRLQTTAATPAARRRNVKGAFAIRYRHSVAGKTICLVDDIKTTGATLNECAKVLKAGGAKKVYALVLAAAGQDLVKA